MTIETNITNVPTATPHWAIATAGRDILRPPFRVLYSRCARNSSMFIPKHSEFTEIELYKFWAQNHFLGTQMHHPKTFVQRIVQPYILRFRRHIYHLHEKWISDMLETSFSVTCCCHQVELHAPEAVLFLGIGNCTALELLYLQQFPKTIQVTVLVSLLARRENGCCQ